MEKNPYLVLGIDESASEREIRDAHERLRKIYSEQLFAEGDVGMNASRKLSELDIALADALELARKQKNKEEFGGEFGAVENAIKSGNLDGAQRLLDNMGSRAGEWHYLQSIIFYKRGWTLESKKQLELALNIDPGNVKYKNSLDRMMASMNRGSGQGYSQYSQHGQGGQYSNDAYGDGRGGYYPPPQNQAPSPADTCCSTCACLCCADSCCDIFNCC